LASFDTAGYGLIKESHGSRGCSTIHIENSSVSELAKKYGVGVAHIYAIIAKRAWSWL